MIIDYSGDTFFARCSFEERLAFKSSGWIFNATTKRWETSDLTKAKVFAPFASDVAHAALESAGDVLLGALGASYAADASIDIPVPAGLSYDPHQRAFVVYAKDRTNVLCGDPPGLGKTIEAVALSNYFPDIRSVLIVCPAHLKINWGREWAKWDVKGLSVGMAQSITIREKKLDPDGERMRDPVSNKPLWNNRTEHSWPETDVVIINYDMLETFHGSIRDKEWDLLIVDESHYLIRKGTQRTRHVFGAGIQKTKKRKDGAIVRQKRPAVEPIRAKRRLLMTGTPLMGKPLDLWPTVEAFDPTGLGKNWISFIRKYCGAEKKFGRYDTSGASNLEQLQTKMRLAFMIRRDKREVMKTLPPKRRQLIELPAEGLRHALDEEVSALRKVRDALATFENLGKPEPTAIEWTNLADVLARRFSHLSDLEYEDRVKHLSPPEMLAFEELSTARKELARAKVPMVVEHVRSYLEQGEKVVVFCVHTDMAEALRLTAWDTGVSFITGKVSPNKRQAEVDRFQDDPNVGLMIANIVAGGTGYTMTAAHIAIFAELDWVPATVEQAEDRIWRRGQKFGTLIQHLAVEGSIDARLVAVLLQKQAIVHSALDITALGDDSQKKDLIFAS